MSFINCGCFRRVLSSPVVSMLDGGLLSWAWVIRSVAHSNMVIVSRCIPPPPRPFAQFELCQKASHGRVRTQHYCTRLCVRFFFLLNDALSGVRHLRIAVIVKNIHEIKRNFKQALAVFIPIDMYCFRFTTAWGHGRG